LPTEALDAVEEKHPLLIFQSSQRKRSSASSRMRRARSVFGTLMLAIGSTPFKAASKAGRSRDGSELHRIKQTLIQLADDVMARRADRGNAAVAGTLLASAIKDIEAEVKVRELEEARLVETELKRREIEELVPPGGYRGDTKGGEE
jgi:hypothetical protein